MQESSDAFWVLAPKAVGRRLKMFKLFSEMKLEATLRFNSIIHLKIKIHIFGQSQRALPTLSTALQKGFELSACIIALFMSWNLVPIRLLCLSWRLCSLLINTQSSALLWETAHLFCRLFVCKREVIEQSCVLVMGLVRLRKTVTFVVEDTRTSVT